MFNSEVKEKYIATRTATMQNEYRNYFIASEPFEIEFGKDVATFSVEEIDRFLRRYGFSEPQTNRNRIGKLSSYSAWYSEQIENTSNAFKGYDITRFPYSEYFGALITRTPEELVNKILHVYEADSAQPAIAALCLAWLGIDLKDAVLLKKEQVDTVHGKIYDMTGNIVVAQMPDIIREILDIYGKTYSAERTQNQTFTVYADDCGYFIKKMRTANSEKKSGAISTKRMMAYILAFKDLYNGTEGNDQSMTYANVQRSGNFYRLHKMAESGVDVFSSKNADKVKLCLGDSKTSHKDSMIMYQAYLEAINEK